MGPKGTTRMPGSCPAFGGRAGGGGGFQSWVVEDRVAEREWRDIRVRGTDRRGGIDLASLFSCITRLGGGGCFILPRRFS